MSDRSAEAHSTVSQPGELTVGQLGEFRLIDRLARIGAAGTTGRDPLRPEASGSIGIGDDAALWTPKPGWHELLTTDALIEDVHFRHSTTSWRDLGWKAMAQNVSDIAAMGALPTRAFVTLGLRRDTRVVDLEELYAGFNDLNDALIADGAPSVPLAGGDTVSSPVTMLSVTVMGALDGDGLRRATGQPGDLLAVTGSLGGSAGGLALLEQGGAALDGPDGQALAALHRRPHPRVAEGRALAGAGVRCGMDLSDGLLGDAGKLAYASGLSATLLLHHLPMPPALVRSVGKDAARGFALGGGEDFELLVAGDAETLEVAAARLAERGLQPLTVVGRLEDGPAGKVTVLDEHGRTVAPPRSSWDHFRQQGQAR
jgi:thiamine-monophosphate kinase